MSERCRHCEQYEKRQSDVRERRVHLWRRGELTDAAAEKLTSEEQRITEELREHPLCVNNSETSSPSTITVGRRRIIHLYEQEQR